ncbi:MAG: PilZ domain-containing protein [Nitrospira sp.]|nr:PilZ domain-containing protein [Nitrospira sp.]
MPRECRKVQRYAVQLPCSFGSNDDMSDATVLNLSAQGCVMTADRLPPASTYVLLEIDLLNGEAPASIEIAGVRWVSGHRCGLEFIRVSPDTLMKLKTFALVLEQTS